MNIYKSILMLIVFFSVTSITIASPKFADAKNMGEVNEEILDEVSGLAASMDNPAVLWTHNDNGSDRRIYAINSSGRILAEYKLNIENSKDWEDIAVGPGPEEGLSYIYVGDIGDNNGTYNKRAIYRFEEPEVAPDQEYAEFEIKEKHIDIIKFKYPDGSRDAEAMMLDPLTKDLYIISKREDNVGIYLIKYPQSTEETITTEHVGTLPYGNEGFSGSGVTAADISPDGREIIIKQYFQVYYYYRAAGETVASALSKDYTVLPYFPEPQGEAICWAYDGSGYYTLSERGSSILQRTPVLYFYQRLTDSKKKSAEQSELSLYVVSFDDDSEIIVNFPDTDNYSLSIYDLQGRLVSLLYSGLLSEGEHRFQIPSSTLSQQVYMIVISNRSGTYAQKVMF